MAIQISHYKLLKKLGAGGMGDVYLAQDTMLSRYVAIKILPRKFTSNPERIGRFQREAQVASILNHPNILTIHEIGEQDGFHYIVTEFVDGDVLSDLIRKGPIAIEEMLRISIAVAEALTAAHEYWIVHRDIKPDNIMLRRDHYVKVLDFGLAKLTDPGIATAHFETQPGTLPGSVRYVAPERLLGEAADPRTDIFSLGIVMYEMLTGSTPFPGNGVLDIIQAILKTEPVPVREARPDVPDTLELIVKKALEKDPAVRYQKAQELLTDLVDFRKILEFEETSRGLRERLKPKPE